MKLSDLDIELADEALIAVAKWKLLDEAARQEVLQRYCREPLIPVWRDK